MTTANEKFQPSAVFLKEAMDADVVINLPKDKIPYAINHYFGSKKFVWLCTR